MRDRQGLTDLLWIAVGTLLLVVVTLLALHFYRQGGLATQETLRARQLGLVVGMRAELASATEAEKSAVMAVTDQESQVFADQARAAAVRVVQRRDELTALLAPEGSREERELLAEFSRAFAECQRIDHKLLDLAVRNTNLKAAALAYGPAAAALASMDSALARIMTESANASVPTAKQALLLAARVNGAARRIQALLPSHIAEESDPQMAAFEAAMARDDQTVRADLKALAALLGQGSSELQAARSDYARFSDLRRQILALSRENTNVKSLTLSLNGKRRTVQVCQEALAALEKAILAEPPATRPLVKPR